MRILWVSRFGDGIELAYRMLCQGDEVRVYIDDPAHKDCLDGLVKKVDSWQSSVAWADLVIFDENEMTHVWNAVHKTKPCFGGSAFGARLEKDRPFAHSVMNKARLARIESLSFKRIEEAQAHIKEHKKPHVVKFMGPKIDSHDTIIGQLPDGEDVLMMLDRFKSRGVPFQGIEVEEKKDGVEVGISAWFNGSDWLYPVNVNFEHKRVCEEETGPLSGEAGTLLRYVEDEEYPFFLRTLDKIKPILKANDYRGQIDLNMIVNEDGDWPLEFTPRFGKPSCFIEDELHITPWAELCYAIATGANPHLKVYYDWAVGVQLFGFGFPFSKEYMKVSHELPVFGIENLDHTHLWQCKEGKNGIVTAGGEGYLLVTTGRGHMPSHAKMRAYEPMRSIYVPNSYYRRDISDKISLLRCKELGILDEKAASFDLA